MGELIFISSNASAPANDADVEKSLVDSMRWFCRSIELCDGYLRGYYGLKLVSSDHRAKCQTTETLYCKGSHTC